jgi:hypothetical protein
MGRVRLPVVEVIPGTGPREQSRFYPPRWKLLLLAATGAFFAAVGFAISGADFRWLAGIGWAMLVGFTLVTLVMLARAVRPGPTVILDAVGITDRTTLIPTGRVRWEEITVVRKREIGRGRGRERVLELVLADPEAFHVRERPAWRRLAERFRRTVGGPHLRIPGTMVHRPMPVVIEELRRWRPELQVLELPPPLPRLRSRRAPGRGPDLPRW